MLPCLLPRGRISFRGPAPEEQILSEFDLLRKCFAWTCDRCISCWDVGVVAVLAGVLPRAAFAGKMLGALSDVAMSFAANSVPSAPNIQNWWGWLRTLGRNCLCKPDIIRTRCVFQQMKSIELPADIALDSNAT